MVNVIREKTRGCEIRIFEVNIVMLMDKKYQSLGI